MTKSTEENNKAPSNLNDKLLEIIKDRGTIASSLLSLLSKITNPEDATQFKLVKDLDSNRVNVFLMNKTIPGTLFDNSLKFRDTDKNFKVEGIFRKMRTNKN